VGSEWATFHCNERKSKFDENKGKIAEEGKALEEPQSRKGLTECKNVQLNKSKEETARWKKDDIVPAARGGKAGLPENTSFTT